MNYLRLVAAGDLDYLCPRLRADDRNECRAATGLDPEAVLPLGVRISFPAQTMVAPDGEPVGLCGVVPVNGEGVVWMMATDRLPTLPMTFLRHCGQWVREVSAQYPRLYNVVDARNEVHIKWLRWLGFTIHPAAPYGPLGIPFHSFEMKRNV